MKILIVDDHAIVRDGLSRLLATDGDHELKLAATGRDALIAARAFRPDLAILDLNLPGLGGLELLRRLVAIEAGKILVLSMHAEPLYARRALEAGAHGYVSKNAAPDELLTAVRRVAAGGRYIEAEIAQALALGAGAETLNALSPRELEIMRLLAAGSSLAEIADALGASYKTIANTCTLIKSKLGVARTADLVRLAIETGVS
ncbi:MAG TPA: response regulator transcription factor [Caulobacteraceae bacterium]|jgi:DNA-binding NarL/FixJ family response regulator|nr:response regulator transcription factor [Caulobacteraceae bacterium]